MTWLTLVVYFVFVFLFFFIFARKKATGNQPLNKPVSYIHPVNLARVFDDRFADIF